MFILCCFFLHQPLLSHHLSGVLNSGDSKEGESSKSEDSNLTLVDQSVIERFSKEVLFPNGSPINCGDRLKVELLKILNLFVHYAPGAVEPARKEVVKFCWGLLKSEDTSCKGWGHLVLSRFIVAFDTAEKIVLQVFGALLRAHQPEGRELVREALDVLVPALPKRLSEAEFQKAIDQATKMILEDNNSIPQLAHVCLVSTI